MHLADTPTRFGGHANAFGFLRLLFASLVIVSHVPEVVDGDRSRELLSMLGFATTFGGVAVSGFFVISGYLIAGSYLNSRSIPSFMTKRIARIYPGFIAASLVSLLIVAPLAGATFVADTLTHAIGAVARMLLLSRPAIDGAFAGQVFDGRYVALNGAMWTIQYEFLCYLMVVALGVVGLLRRPWVVVALSLALLLASLVVPAGGGMDMLFPGQLSALPQLCGLFLAGSAFYLLRDHVRIGTVGVLIAIVGLAALSRFEQTMSIGYALFGAYLIFAAARRGGATWLRRVNDKVDISYGVYLYAWPAEQLLIRYGCGGNLLLLGVGTLVIAMLCGLASWFAVEKPAMEWARRWQKSHAAAQTGGIGAGA